MLDDECLFICCSVSVHIDFDFELVTLTRLVLLLEVVCKAVLTPEQAVDRFQRPAEGAV